MTTIKSGISLYSSKTVFFYYYLLKIVVFGHFDRISYVDYGPNRDSDRRLLWEELNWVFSWWEAPLFVCVCVCARTRAQEFFDFIFSRGLVDFPLEGGDFMWSNIHSHSHINKFLLTPLLKEHLSMITQRCLIKILSDNYSILLECSVVQCATGPFRFGKYVG